jgi:hypothetical protein
MVPSGGEETADDRDGSCTTGLELAPHEKTQMSSPLTLHDHEKSLAGTLWSRPRDQQSKRPLHPFRNH